MAALRRRTALPALALALAAALGGCSGVPSPTTSSPATLPAIAPDAPLVPGTVVATPELGEAARADGYGVYTTTTGALLVIDPEAPLPEAVTTDLITALAPVLADTSTDPAAAAANTTLLTSALDALGMAGKEGVLLIEVPLASADGATQAAYVVVSEAPGFTTAADASATADTGPFTTAADARAFVAQRLGGVADANRYAVVEITR